MNPKVSVIVPNYNHARFLEQRLRSVLDQTFTDFEVIYLDDASTDQSAEVFKPFADHPRIRSHMNAVNSGSPFKQWNRGASMARGELLWVAEADDYADPHLLETLVPLLDNNPSVGVAYGQSLDVDAQGHVGRPVSQRFLRCDSTRWEQPYVNDGRHEVANYLIWECTIPNASGVVFRKRTFEQAGRSAENLRLAGDYATWIRLLRISDIAFTPRSLNYWRCHSGSVRSRRVLDGTLTTEMYCLLQYIREHFQVSDEIVEKVCFERAHDWLHLALFGQERLKWRANWKVFRTARRADPHVYRRLARMFLYMRKRRRQLRRQRSETPPSP